MIANYTYKHPIINNHYMAVEIRLSEARPFKKIVFQLFS